MKDPRSTDGAIGEGWGGRDPNGCHVNLVLARRGGATAATLMTAFTGVKPGHSPILVCVGEAKDRYEPVWPPTIMLPKSTTTEPDHESITFGATQLGIGQGILDAVADGVLEATDETIVFVSVWIDAAATEHTDVRVAARTATRKAAGMAAQGRDPEAAAALVARRDTISNPYYPGD